jgi:type I restriction enzyme S subunit
VNEYLLYFLESLADRWNEFESSGSVFANLGKTDLGNVLIPLPPLSEQRAIAATLGALDDKIESNRRAIDLAEHLADQLFAINAVDVVMLTDVAGLTMGSSPPGDTYNLDGVGLPFYQGVRDFGRRYPGHRVWTTGAIRLAHDNDSLVSVRAPVGELNRSLETCCIGRGVAAISSKFSSSIYYALRASDATWEPFQHEGTVFGAINKSDLSNARLSWPASDALDSLENQLSAIDEKIRSLSKEIEVLTALRDTLLPELLSGRLQAGEAKEVIL